jgi:hypothetical protein
MSRCWLLPRITLPSLLLVTCLGSPCTVLLPLAGAPHGMHLRMHAGTTGQAMGMLHCTSCADILHSSLVSQGVRRVAGYHQHVCTHMVGETRVHQAGMLMSLLCVSLQGDASKVFQGVKSSTSWCCFLEQGFKSERTEQGLWAWVSESYFRFQCLGRSKSVEACRTAAV